MPRLALATALLFVASVASAQPAGNMQLDEFHPAIDSRGYLTLNGTSMLDHEDLSFGLGSLEWGRHMLEFQNQGATYSVDNMVSATLVGAMGLRLGGVPLEVGASLPFSILNGTQDHVDGQGIGDLGLHLKTRLYHHGGFGVGAIGSVFLPTASPRDRFMGEPAVTPQLMGLADLAVGRFRFAANGGVRLRQTSTFTDMGATGMPATMGTITTGTELPGGVAAAFALSPEKVELIAEVDGALELGQHQGYQPLEALGGVKVYLAKNSYLSIGAGRGLVTSQGNPDFRGFIGIVFEPKAAARHHVAIADDDVVAVAPPPAKHDEPEELIDTDGDGIFDKDDKCPTEPGPIWNDGCPERDEVKVEDAQIVILKGIEFEFDSAVIKDESFGILDEVVKALKQNPEIRLVEVQGHTDERGSHAYNDDLSKRRAASVVTYLNEHGIDMKRLTSHGYGKRKPKVEGHDEAAWRTNRRVEFIIKDRDGMK